MGSRSARSPATLRSTLRIALAVLLLAMGIGKALDLSGFGHVIDTYRLGLPTASLGPLALVIAALEIVIGVWLLANRNLRAAAIATVLVSSGYFVLLVATLVRGIGLDNCGCFGVFFAQPLSWLSPLEDVAVIAAGLALMRLAAPDPHPV